MNITKKEKIVRNILIASFLLVILVLCIVFFDSLKNEFIKTFIDSGNGKTLLNGFANTFLITIFAFLIGIIVGSITCIIEQIESKNTFVLIIKQIFKFYVSIFRGTPVVVQLLIIYFIIFASYRGNPLIVAIITFGLNSGAYVSEIIRGGINSIPVGQKEAGKSLGLPYRKIMTKIILPQAYKNALPSLGNELITLVKETSVASFITIIDLTNAFKIIANGTYSYEMPYIIMGITYFIIVLILSFILKLIEKRLMKSDRT